MKYTRLLLLVAGLLVAAACGGQSSPQPTEVLPAKAVPTLSTEVPGTDAAPVVPAATNTAVVSPLESPLGPAVATDEPFQSPLGLPNPASEFCVSQGYRLEIRTEAGGDVGYCIFSDGSECEEWAFYRGECAPQASP